MVKIKLVINGKEREGEAEPRMLLVHFIRDVLGLKGTHVGCDTGHCGACTILLDGKPVKSCSMLAVQADGSSLSTVEGLSPEEGQFSIEQESFRNHFSLQCGYCTPGFLMMTRYLATGNEELSKDEIREKLHGNYCMCTGYQFIIDAVQEAQKRYLSANTKNVENK